MKRSTIQAVDLNTNSPKKVKISTTPRSKERTVEVNVNPGRVTTLYQPTTSKATKGNVLYWMSRDQRSCDNWALLYAAQQAAANQKKVAVVFNIVPTFLGSTKRIHTFMMQGLQQVESCLKNKGIPMFLLYGEPQKTIPAFISEHQVSDCVCDYSPLKTAKKWKEGLVGQVKEKKLNCRIFEVDAHNVVPVTVVSRQQEYAARTIRPKVTSHFGQYLTAFPELADQEIEPKHPLYAHFDEGIDWTKAYEIVDKQDDAGDPITWIKPGELEALKAMQIFLEQKMPDYGEKRNDPNMKAVSGLSPYLHFGHISAQRLAAEALDNSTSKTKASVDSFVEELVVRRELADNFCHYNSNYDSVKGFPEWAQISLNLHKDDKRYKTYTLEQLEHYKTHDELWNAAQIEMVVLGKMHGFMRMYWAKKILEWTESPEKALEYAIYLNDRYELDGRDPNGYVGCAWSIGGVHDQGWAERSVFGKVRYMNYEGCKRKFDVAKYVKTTNALLKDRKDKPKEISDFFSKKDAKTAANKKEKEEVGKTETMEIEDDSVETKGAVKRTVKSSAKRKNV